MKTLGIIGLGAIGQPIARQLIDGGFQLYTTVRSERSRKKAADMGIQILEHNRDFARVADRILLIVSNYDQCAACLLGDNGLFSTLKKGTVILSSTVAPGEAEILSAACPEGVTLVDAPVSGGAPGAEKGTLVAITAGEQQAVDSCRDIFDCYCRKLVYAGEVPGQAQALKAVNQMLVSIHMTATAEAMAFSTALGIDPSVMFETISECAGNSNIFQSRMPKLMAGDFSAGASLETLEKDTRLCMDLSDAAGVPCYLTKMCHNLFSRTPRAENQAEDACSVIRLYQNDME